MSVAMCPKCGNYYRRERPHVCPTWDESSTGVAKGVQQPMDAEGYQHSESACPLTDDQIMSECAALDDVVGSKAGYSVSHIDGTDCALVRWIDGRNVRFMEADRWLSLADFSTRIIRPLITLPRNPEPTPETVRGTTHGDYTTMAVTAQNIKIAMKAGTNWGSLTPVKTEALHMIATKLARIVCGDSNCHDHWDDIAGYARLVSDRIARRPKGS